MIKELHINPDRYDKKKPEHVNKKVLINPAYDNSQPDYYVSDKLKKHIISDPKFSFNQKIKILDSGLNINPFLNILKLHLSFIINNQLLDPTSKNKQNYRFNFDINLINYRQIEGVFENLEQDLY